MLKLAIVLIPYIIFVGIMVIGFVTGFAYQNHLDNIDEKIVKVIDMNGLVEFLLNLQNRTSNSVIKTTLVKLIEKASFKVKDEEKTELKKIEKRIFEYALFIEKDIKNNNVNNFFYLNILFLILIYFKKFNTPYSMFHVKHQKLRTVEKTYVSRGT